MGCGQSKIHLYPRKSKSKANGKKGGHADSDAETDEDEGHVEDAEKYQSNREQEKNEEAEEQSNKDNTQETDEEVSVSLLRAKNLSLLQSQEISSSQQNFFRMLDKKIEEGPDYDSASETEIALEEARLNALVQHWEDVSVNASICSSASRSLQTTPIRQAPVNQLAATPRPVLQTTVQQVLNADFLPHGVLQSAQQLSTTGGMFKHPQSQQQQQQQQQILISHMNAKILHSMSVAPQIPMSMSPDASAINATANTSNALALMQASPNQQSQQYTHLLTLPTGSAVSPQILVKPNVSPKRISDAAPRLLINPSPLAQQIHPSQLQNQYSIASPSSVMNTAPQGFLNGGRSTGMPMPMTYFGQLPTAQQQIPMQSAATQQLQLEQHTPQSQIQSYYSGGGSNSDPIHSMQAPQPEYRFPPAISVQRLAPQVQRQLRETQELIKDSCPQLYAAGYGGSPGPPIRSNQARTQPNRRPTLETQFSQESS